jgi:hypothetical protein
MFSSSVSIADSFRPVARITLSRPDVDRADLRDVDDLVALDRVRQPPVEAGAHGGAVASEARDHRLLAFLHDEDAGAHPDHDHDDGDQAGAHARALHVGLEVAVAAAAEVPPLPPRAAAEQAAELAVEVAPQLVEVGRPLVRAPCRRRGACRRVRCLRRGPSGDRSG